MPDFGVLMFPTDYAIQPIELGRAAEERGFESLFFPEHTHIPASRKSPYPGGGDLPKEYWHTHDPFVALAAVAATTKKLKLGFGICLVVERDPIVMAKEVASLDTISGGRVLFGIGGGWNAEEMENHGVPFKPRWKIVREKILAMKQIWTKDAAEFHGEHIKFDPIWSYPKPVQPGGPPVLMGSLAPRAYERVVDYCDGWIPVLLRGFDVAKGVRELREVASRKGRAFNSISLSAFGAPGKEEEVAKLIELGFQRLIFWLPPVGADQALPLLDGYAKLARKFS